MRQLVTIMTLAASLLSGCASRRALREDTTAVVALPAPAASRAYYRAALSVATMEGYSPLHAAEPDGFGVHHEPLRPRRGGAACEGVRLDASFETGDGTATFAFAPCLVEGAGGLFAENGLEICTPQVEWEAASCIDAAIARLKGAWRAEAEKLVSQQAEAARRSAPPSAPAFTNAALDAGASAGGCMKDTECKAERICDRGRCIDPARR